MIVSSQTMVTEADVRVLDLKCHVSVPKEPSFQIGESVRAEKLGSAEVSRLELVMSFSGTYKDPVTEFLPNIHSGSYADIGCRDSMDDEHICIDDLSSHFESSLFNFSVPSAFYAVFDGLGGPNATAYIKQNAMKLFFRMLTFHSSPQLLTPFS